MADSFGGLLPLADPGQVSIISQTLGTVLDRDRGGVLTLVKRDGWVAVALPSSFHCSSRDQLRVTKAIEEFHSVGCFAVTLEPLEGFPPVLAVPSTLDGIRDLNEATGHFNVALFSGTPDWIVACTTDDYFLIAGPPRFVHVAAGGDVDEVITRFQEYADDPAWTPDVRRTLLRLLDALREYAVVDPGTPVRLGN
jgi:hypothetical protein